MHAAVAEDVLVLLQTAHIYLDEEILKKFQQKKNSVLFSRFAQCSQTQPLMHSTHVTLASITLTYDSNNRDQDHATFPTDRIGNAQQIMNGHVCTLDIFGIPVLKKEL
ncbi:hypothetical protein ACJX0J_039182 [Zea mays]